MILMMFLVFLMVSWQFWLREYHFIRIPTAPDISNTGYIFSPAEGTVVGVSYCKGSPHIVKQRERHFNHDYGLDNNKGYDHVTIFMSVFDTHYLAETMPGKIINIETFGRCSTIPMMNYIDSLLTLIGVGFFSWVQRSKTFFTYNQQFVITYDNGIVLIITMDKYVNAFTPVYDVQGFLYFIHKGSQTDILVPQDLGYAPYARLHDHVSYNQALFVSRLSGSPPQSE